MVPFSQDWENGEKYQLRRASPSSYLGSSEDELMKEKTLTIPEIAQISGTRFALGAGIGLLLADKLNQDQRRGVGWALVAVGVLSTIPIAANLFSKESPGKRSVEFEQAAAI